MVQIKIPSSVVQEALKNISQVKTLCNVVFKVPDTIAQKNVLFNVVIILQEQHCIQT